jgi:predicted DNA binding CopG/RHH family protein
MCSLGMLEKPSGIRASMAVLSRKQPLFSPTRMPWSGKTWNIPATRIGSRDWVFPTAAGYSSWFRHTGGRMGKKRFVSSQRAVRVPKNAKPTQNNRIDFSDLPEPTTDELSRARRVGRPISGNAKQLIAIRISPRLLAQLRRLAAKRDKPYQTLIHELLEQAARKTKVA